MLNRGVWAKANGESWGEKGLVNIKAGFLLYRSMQ